MVANKKVVAAALLLLSFEASASPASVYVQEAKLVGTGAVGQAHQGSSVALSADGNTAIVGGTADFGGSPAFSSEGAAWVYTRTGGLWSQQGAKLVGTGAIGGAHQGNSVALSADGNTAIVGGWGDYSNTGALWVFTRSGGVWSQQGTKLVGTGAVGVANQGIAVAVSADGSTAIAGGYADNGYVGAAWVFTRSGGVWTQQGAKLIGADAVGAAHQGYSVSLSADGNTAIVGGYGDAGSGAAWVYTRSGGVWSQQGAKLVGSGAYGPGQGISVSLSGDGNTAILGGDLDDSGTGAAWVFARSGGVWSQQGAKLVGTDAVGPSIHQGISVALSGDGNTGIVGGYGDNGYLGAAWVYTRSGGVWSQQGAKLVGTDTLGTLIRQGCSVALSGDASTAIMGGYGDNSSAGAAWVFVNELTTGTLISLMSADPGQGGVTLTWQSESAPGLSAAVYRHDLSSTWQSIGTPTLVPPDRLQFVDRAVTPGARYAYRLGYAEGGPQQFTAETWVDLPRSARLSLDGVRPNPSAGAMSVSLSLPDGSSATLTVLDLAGRVVMSHEVGSLGAGQHIVALSLGPAITPGVYWLRLEQANHATYARAAVIR